MSSAMWLDARIPVLRVPPDRLAEAWAAHPDAVVLVEEGLTPPEGAQAESFPPGTDTGHAAGCACCIARSPAAAALDRLFLARVTGRGAFFGRVIAATATERGAMALAVALSDDPVVPIRYRPG